MDDIRDALVVRLMTYELDNVAVKFQLGRLRSVSHWLVQYRGNKGWVKAGLHFLKS